MRSVSNAGLKEVVVVLGRERGQDSRAWAQARHCLLFHCLSFSYHYFIILPLFVAATHSPGFRFVSWFGGCCDF